MSKHKSKITKGPAQVVITGEPVYVKELFTLTDSTTGDSTPAARVIRAKVGTEGLVYINDQFPVEELETRLDYTKRQMEYEQAVDKLRYENEQERYSLNDAQLTALKKSAAQAIESKTAGKPIMLEGMDA